MVKKMIRRPILSSFAAFYSRNFSISFNETLEVKDEIRSALFEKKAVVALESTVITHGMPFPDNVQCALEVEDIVRSHGSIPATVGLINGKVKVGLSRDEIEFLGNTEKSKPIKTSRRDYPYVVSRKLNGGTTVSGTLIACGLVGVPIFATGGIGGVHRGASNSFDISADLTELGRSNVAVISSGVKSILDIPKTLEYLETEGVFVATFGPTTEFPAFYCRSSGFHAPYCVENTKDASKIIKSHRDLGLKSGLLFAVPVPEKYALDLDLIDSVIEEALRKADGAGIKGKDVTPFLLSEVAKITTGSSLETNVALIKNNAKVAAEIAVHLSQLENGRGNFSSNSEDHSRKMSSDKQPVIIGGCNLDCVAYLETDDIKLDGRIHLGRFDYTAGGVGRNICEALGKLGLSSHFISAVGNDQQGRILMEELPKQSLNCLKIFPGHHTAQVVVVLDKAGNCSFLIGDMNIHKLITPEMIEENEELIKKSPLIVIDGNLSEETMGKALELAQKHAIPVFYEPTDITISRKPFTTDYWKAIKFITPNIDELKHIYTFLHGNYVEKYNDKIKETAALAGDLTNFIDNVIVTLGPEGVLIARKGLVTDPFLKHYKTKEIYVRHYPVEEKTNFVNVSGAGDCFASGFIAALLENLPEKQCISVGFAAALSALYSHSAVPKRIFQRRHQSWQQDAKYITL